MFRSNPTKIRVSTVVPVVLVAQGLTFAPFNAFGN
jgi:hypothetical protein